MFLLGLVHCEKWMCGKGEEWIWKHNDVYNGVTRCEYKEDRYK